MSPIALSLAGSEEQKEYWLPKIAGGEKLIGVGLSEFIGAREDTAISFSNDTLSGRALFIIDGKKPAKIIAKPRIGIKVGINKLWNFSYKI